MLYWLPGTGASSARLYWESSGAFKAQSLGLPVGVTIFPEEIFRPSRRWAERSYSNIIHWNEVAKGGHFAAFEQPATFVSEVRSCFRTVRKA
jgi:pimeloyl-ACP methyl ester carboxylesterase